MSMVHQYDQDGFYVGPAEDFGGPMPHGCAPEAPPQAGPDGGPIPAGHKCRRLSDGKFVMIEDYRGQTGYKTDTGEAVVINGFGPWPENLAREAKPGRAYEWDGQQWVYNIRLDSPGLGYEFDEEAQTWLKTRFSVFSFLNLFTLEEKTGLKKAVAEGNYEAAAIYDSFIAADYIDLRNQAIADNVRRLASEGHRFLTDQRAAEILRGQAR